MLMMLEVADGDQTLRTVFRFTLYSAQSHRRLERKSRGGQQTADSQTQAAPGTC